MDKHGSLSPLKAGLAALAATMLLAGPAHAIKLAEGWDLNGKFFADFSLAENDPDSGFHLKRTYVMLKGALAPDLLFRLTLDQRYEDDRVFVKHAYLDKAFAQELHLQGGLIGTPYVPWDEKNFWGYRFVEKSFTDYWGLQSSADLGVGLIGEVGRQNLSYHVTVTNGEGYQNTPDGEGFAATGRLAAGVQGVQVGGFIHLESDRNGTPGYDPFRLGGYLYVETSQFRVGGQYVAMDDAIPAGVYDHDYGINVQGRFKLPMGTDTWLFARYDRVDVTNPPGFFQQGKNDLLIAGVSFDAGHGLTIAPNIKRFDAARPGPPPTTDTEMVVGVHVQLTF